MGIFGRAARGENLAPLERAALRFLAVVVWGALLAGLQAALPLLSKPDAAVVPWASVAHTFLAAFVLALALGVSKFHTAQGDPPLPVAGLPVGGALRSPVAYQLPGAIPGASAAPAVARPSYPPLAAPPAAAVVVGPPTDLPSAVDGIPSDLVAAASPPVVAPPVVAPPVVAPPVAPAAEPAPAGAGG